MNHNDDGQKYEDAKDITYAYPAHLLGELDAPAADGVDARASAGLRPEATVDWSRMDRASVMPNLQGANVSKVGPRGGPVEPGAAMQVDWGEEFRQFEAQHLPGPSAGALTLAVGALASRFAVEQGLAAFLPASHVKPQVDTGRLHLVEDVPRFSYPIWSVWRDDLDDDLAAVSATTLHDLAARAGDEIAALLGPGPAAPGLATRAPVP